MVPIVQAVHRAISGCVMSAAHTGWPSKARFKRRESDWRRTFLLGREDIGCPAPGGFKQTCYGNLPRWLPGRLFRGRVHNLSASGGAMNFLYVRASPPKAPVPCHDIPSAACFMSFAPLRIHQTIMSSFSIPDVMPYVMPLTAWYSFHSQRQIAVSFFSMILHAFQVAIEVQFSVPNTTNDYKCFVLWL